MNADACLHMSNINTENLIPTSSLFKKYTLFQINSSSFMSGFSFPELQSQQDLSVYLFFQACFGFNVII